MTAFLCSTATGVLFGWLPAPKCNGYVESMSALARNNPTEMKLPAAKAGIELQDVHGWNKGYATPASAE
ncbi:hypothetical protein ACNKHK_05405 [Shigella flexneri]